jgi:hypothetical protein
MPDVGTATPITDLIDLRYATICTTNLTGPTTERVNGTVLVCDFIAMAPLFRLAVLQRDVAGDWVFQRHRDANRRSRQARLDPEWSEQVFQLNYHFRSVTNIFQMEDDKA